MSTILLALAALAGPPREDLQKQVTALVSFDVAKARRAYPGLGVSPETDEATRRRARRLVMRALAKYPAKSLLRHLKAVFVVHDIWWEKAHMGGASMPGGHEVFVAVGAVPWYDEDWIEGAVHHEFAHLLYDSEAKILPSQAWTAANAPGFKYSYGENGGYDALTADDTGEELDSRLNLKGVLSAYGASSITEDWATYAQMLIGENGDFFRAVRLYPRVRTKAELALEFYRKAMPGMRLPKLPLRSV